MAVRRLGGTTALRAASFSSATKNAEGTPEAEGAVPHDEFEVNHLAGKNTRDNIHSAFASRAMAAVKYEYFAQRAELECELDAAATFKSLTDTAKQQAMGYLELMEDYGDADFGRHLGQPGVSAQNEREDAEERYTKFARSPAGEQLDQVDQWFQDMSGGEPARRRKASYYCITHGT